MAKSIFGVSSTSNGSDRAVTTHGDPLAGADSMTCHQFDMTSNNDNASNKMVTKRRPRPMMAEISPHARKDVSENIPGANGQGGRCWGWDDEGVEVDINILISEFGDFSDFFQEEELDFGEPPGTASLHTPIIPAPDFGDDTFTDSPSAALDIHEERPPVDFTCLDTNDHQNVAPAQDVISKAEAMLTFAPEYAAIEIPVGEAPTALFTNPYLPISKKSGSSRFSSRIYPYNVTQSSEIESIRDKPVQDVLKCAATPYLSLDWL